MAYGGTRSPTDNNNGIYIGTIMGAGEGVRLERSSSRQTFDSVESDECLDSDYEPDTSVEDLNEALKETDLELEKRIDILILKAKIDEKQHDEEKRRIEVTKDNEINKLQIAAMKMEDEMGSLENELWNAQQQLNEFRDVKKALEDAKQNIKKLKEENNDLNKEKRNLKKDLQDLRKACDSIRSELNDKYEEMSLSKQNVIQKLKCEILSANERMELLINHQKKQSVKFEAEMAKQASERKVDSIKRDQMHNKMHNEMKEMKEMMKDFLKKKEAEVVPKKDVVFSAAITTVEKEKKITRSTI